MVMKEKRQEMSLVILSMCLLCKDRQLFRDFNWIWTLLGHAAEERTDNRIHDKH